MSLGDTSVAPENGANGSQQLSEEARQVQEVLSSEIGVSTMLNRLKQSIASAKEFAVFLKKRSALEDEHAQGLKRLCKMSQDSMRRPEHREGSFGRAFDEMMNIHERICDNGMQFAMSLYQMHDDLMELASMADKSRKGWKQNGLAPEQRVAELNAAMLKSKAKYDALAEEYERARTGDVAGQKGRFGFKGPKSAAQHEEDVLRKVNGADLDYHGKVQALQAERGELVARTRPEAIRALQDLVRECDSGLVLQMQKFASFNEKLLLSNGLSISPLKTPDKKPSLREVVSHIDNDRDLNDFLIAYYTKMPPRTGEPKYERHPVLNNPPPSFQASQGNSSQYQMPVHPPMGQVSTQQLPPSRGGPGAYVDSPVSPQGGRGFGHSGHGSISGPVIPPAQRAGPPDQRHERSFSHGSLASQNTIPLGQQYPARNSAQQPVPSSRFNSSTQSSHGPTSSISQTAPQLGALPFQVSQQQQPPPQAQQPSQGPPPLGGGAPNPLQQHPPSHPAASGVAFQGRAQSPPQAAPSRPVFGISLSKLYERDGLAVPMVVYQCIQAVDLYGLGVEGIYRLSGSLPHVNKLKGMFDTDSRSPELDFRNPENFFHDVNSVAGLLKQFFRDLPDPLLTAEHYSGFIEAAKNDDDIVRRDSLHAIINNLPDPNYATLRALTLHLYRVMDNSTANRMNSQNLAIVFGPTLMGTAPGSNITDAGWQVRVVDTILQNTYQIFDDD